MQLGLVYLGLLLLIGACYLFMRYSLKRMNNKIIDILELTNTLAQEMEQINKFSNFLGKARDDNSESINISRNVNSKDTLQIISDDDESEGDESEDDESGDDESEVGEVGEVGEVSEVGSVKELLSEKIIIEDKEIIDIDEDNSTIMGENLDSLIIETIIDDKTDINKMTVSSLKLLIKEKDPTIKLTNLKRNDLLNILNNEQNN